VTQTINMLITLIIHITKINEYNTDHDDHDSLSEMQSRSMLILVFKYVLK